MIDIFKEGVERIASIFKKWVDDVNEFDIAITKVNQIIKEESERNDKIATAICENSREYFKREREYNDKLFGIDEVKE